MTAACTSCQKALRAEARNAICLRCLVSGVGAANDNDFAEEEKTSPGILPRGLRRAAA
jgi:hypothetical protein